MHLGKGDTPVAFCEANKAGSVLRELLLLQPSLNPTVLHEENWKARRIAILISVPRPSSLLSTIDMEARPSQYAARNSRIIISVDGNYELQENGPLDTLRLARKSLQKMSNSPIGSQAPQGYYLGLSEWEMEHRAYVDIQDLFVSLYLVNPDLWRYVIMYL